MNELTNYIFVEKYRPRTIDEVVFNEKVKIKNYLKNTTSVPHFIFASKTPGTGKTTLAFAIIKEMQCDHLILNSSDDRNLETIRDKVKIFARAVSIKQGLKKCIFMDEFDGMTSASQNALRNIMETYANNCFFILTCNNLEKIILPIQSRCIRVDFSSPDRIQIYNYLVNICKNEEIKYEEAGLKWLVNNEYPNIRNMVMLLQDFKISEKPVTQENTLQKEKYLEVYKLLEQKKIQDLRKLIYSGQVEVTEFNSWLFRKIFQEVTPTNFNKLKIIAVILAENEKAFTQGANPDIIFLASIFQIMDNLNG